MISSEGKDADENKTPSTNYQNFLLNDCEADPTDLASIKEKSAFIPNILINYTTGEGWFGGGSTMFDKDGGGQVFGNLGYSEEIDIPAYFEITRGNYSLLYLFRHMSTDGNFAYYKCFYVKGKTPAYDESAKYADLEAYNSEGTLLG